MKPKRDLSLSFNQRIFHQFWAVLLSGGYRPEVDELIMYGIAQVRRHAPTAGRAIAEGMNRTQVLLRVFGVA